MADLNGTVAVVTGAGRGIGREIALHQARCGETSTLTPALKTGMPLTASVPVGSQKIVSPNKIQTENVWNNPRWDRKRDCLRVAGSSCQVGMQQGERAAIPTSGSLKRSQR